jgi:hypothetical protein
MYSDNNIDITYNNSDRYYSMKAKFSKRKTREVEEYMDSRIGNRTKMSFVNTRIDGTIALDDQTLFYINKSPGILTIKLDKDANSEEAYERIKSMCEGIKPIVTNAE